MENNSRKIVQSFTVMPIHERDITSIGTLLNKELAEMQENGWIVKDIIPQKFSFWDYPKSYDATMFIVIAEHDEKFEEDI